MSGFLQDFLRVLPLLVVLILLLPPVRAHVLVAGLVGGIVAMLVGGLSIAAATDAFVAGTVQLLSIASVILFASTAIVLARAGSISSTLAILQRTLKGRVQYIVPAMVLVQALAVYGAGHGAANTLVTAPLVFTAVGFNVLTVVALSLVSGASWATSPASAESGVISEAMGISVQEYADFMLPFTVTIWVIAVIIAYVGVSRALRNGTLKPGASLPDSAKSNAGEDELEEADVQIEARSEPLLGDPNVAHWRRAFPFFFLLALIIFGPYINRAVGSPIFTNFTIPTMTLILAALLVKIPVNKVAEEFADGSRVILIYLFLVGVFLGFVNMMSEIGTFEVLAGLPGGLPGQLVGIGALVIAFLIAVPSASYTAAIDAIILPVMAAAGVPVALFGFVGIAVAQGAMMSPVQVNVAATAHGFQTNIMRVVRNNAPYMPLAVVLTIVMSVIAVSIAAF